VTAAAAAAMRAYALQLPYSLLSSPTTTTNWRRERRRRKEEALTTRQCVGHFDRKVLRLQRLRSVVFTPHFDSMQKCTNVLSRFFGWSAFYLGVKAPKTLRSASPGLGL